jgi:cytochrome P450
MPLGRSVIEGYDPIWLVTKYKDIQQVARDPEQFHSADFNPILQPVAGDEFTRELDKTPIRGCPHLGSTRVMDTLTYMDPPEHGANREPFMPVFAPAACNKLEAHFTQLAREAVDGLIQGPDEIDFVKDFAYHYPLRVIMSLIGVPQDDYPLMQKLTDDYFGGADPEEARDDVPLTADAASRQWAAAIQDFCGYFDSLKPERRARPQDDLMTFTMNVEVNGEKISNSVQNAWLLAMAAAGHDTTSSSIAEGTLGLIRFPDQMRLVQDDLSLVPGLVDECIRYTTPAKHFMRNATRDTVLRDVEIKANDRLMLLYDSGNRDEEVFTNPDRFDVTRRPNRHLAFSWGPHMCIGQYVTKLEMRLLFKELLPRINSVEIVGEPRYVASNFVSALKSLPVRIHKK